MEQHNYTPEIRELALKYQAALERMEIQHFKEIQSLKTQLETARKALDRIRLHNDSYVSHRIATEALDLIGAGQTDKCPRCGVVALNAESLAAGCLNCGYTAGQKGGK